MHRVSECTEYAPRSHSTAKSVSIVDALTHWHCLLEPSHSLSARCAGVTGSRCGESLTWVFSTATPLDEAHDEQDQDDEGDCTHQADEPALSGDVHLVYVSCGRRTSTSGGEERRGRRQWDNGHGFSGLDIRQHVPRLGLSAAGRKHAKSRSCTRCSGVLCI